MIGRTINQYKILEKLGGGGMGVVYKAQDVKLDRPVALKFLPPHLGHDDVEKKRFIHEAKAASALDHNNICNIHDIDETEDGQLFIVMAYYAGETVKKKIDRGKLPVDEALDITLQVTQGLGQAHINGILHRDIKPANILVTEDRVVKIVDFGLAKLLDKTRLTKTGSTVGTVAYMSPEQGSGSEVDARSDLWSLGVLLYEMLAGELPFQGDYEQAVIYSIMNTEPKPISEFRKDMPEGLEEMVNHCLEKSPENRYENVQHLQEDIEELIETRLPRITAHRLKRSIPRGSARWFQRAAVSTLVVILLIAAWGNFVPDRYSLGQLVGFTGLPAEKSVAVLPFVTLGDGLHNETFSIGLVETLTSKLTQLEQFKGSLWVVSAADVWESGIMIARDAWQRLKIRLVITGSLQFQGDEIRLTLNLQDAKTSQQLNSEVITGSTAEIFVFQDSAAVVLAKMLDIELNPESREALAAGRTYESKAFGNYVEGRGYLQDYQKIENIDQAIVHFDKALEHDPGYALAYAGLGEAYWRKFERDKDVQWIDMAQSNCEKAIRLAENISATHFTMGLIHSGKGNYELALEEFEAAIKLDPVSDEAHREIAQVYLKQGRPEIAKTYYLKAIELAPNYWANYNSLGVFYFLQGSFADAAEQFQKVVALRPDIMRGYSNLGGTYFLLDRWTDAKKVLEQALNLEPNEGTYSQLGTIYFYERRYADAAAMFKKARDLSPEDYRYWGYIAFAYLAIPGKDDEARNHCEKAARLAERQLEVNPQDVDLLCDLADYHAIMRNPEQAFNLLGRAEELGVHDSQLMFQIGEIYEQLGERETALKWISSALDQGISMTRVNHSPFLTNLRLDVRFQMVIDAKKE